LRGDVPTLSGVGDDRDGLLVVPGQHAHHERTTVGLKLNPVADVELEHFGMRSHLMEEAQAFHDAIVEVDQFCFGEFVDVDLHVTPQRD